MVWWHFYSQLCSKQCAESQLALIPIHTAQCERVPQQTQSAQGQLPALPLHIIPASTSAHFHSSHQVSRNAQLSPVQNRSANSASQWKQARRVGLSHNGSVVDMKIKKTLKNNFQLGSSKNPKGVRCLCLISVQQWVGATSKILVLIIEVLLWKVSESSAVE